MIRSLLLRLIAFLALLLPVLMVVSGLVHLFASRITFSPFQFTYGVLSSPVSVGENQQVHAASTVSVVVSSGTSIVGGPSLSSQRIEQVFSASGSPARGTGQALYDLSQAYQIDDAYALAVFAEESSFGKAGVAVQTHGLGNIICAGYSSCDGRFRSYPTWQEGYADFYRLMVAEYIPRGLDTVEQIEPVYAPSNENDTASYIHNVVQFMKAFRSA